MSNTIQAKFNFSILMIMFAVALCGCNSTDPVVSKQPQLSQQPQLSKQETERQIELIAAIGDFDSLLGREASELQELLSLANEVHNKEGNIIAYKFYRSGAGGNDDGSDTPFTLIVDGGTISSYEYLVILH